MILTRPAHPRERPQKDSHALYLLPTALVRIGDDLVLNNNTTTTSIMRCQEPTKQKRSTLEHDIPSHASSLILFPTGDPPHPTYRRQRCVKRSPQIRISLAGKKRARNVCPRACSRAFQANGGLIGDESGVHPHTGRTRILNTLHAGIC